MKNINNKEKDVILKGKYLSIVIISVIILIGCISFTTYKFVKYKNLDNKVTKDANNEVEVQNPEISKKEIVLKLFNSDIEYLSKWTYKDFIDNLVNITPLDIELEYKIIINDKELLSDQEYLFDTVGNLKVIIKTINDQKEITLNIVDTIKPIITGIKNKTITVGDKIDLLSGISATDEFEGNIEVKTDSTVNTSKAGTYTVLVYATDHNGNRTEATYKVTVKAKSTTNPSTGNSSGSNSGSTSTQTGCTFTNTLKKRGYKKEDPDACQKDAEASAIAKQIASEILAKGYTKDIDKVEAAAEAVASNYDPSKHVESGFDYRTAYGVFVTHSASCAGCTRALLLVLEYMGFKNMTHTNENGYTHQWVILEMDGQKGFADGQVGMVGYGCHPVDDDPSCSA